MMNFEKFPTNTGEAGEELKTEAPEKSPVDRIGREETERNMPEMLRMATKGLGDLFEILPKDRETGADDIINLLEHTELRIMLPGMRKKFADEAIREKIHLAEDKPNFIARALETDAMKLFVHLEAGKAGTSATFARLQEEREAAARTEEGSTPEKQ